MKKGILQIILFLLYCVFTLFPSGSQAGTVQIPGFYASVIPPSSNALPVLKPGGLQQGISGRSTTTSNTLVINQNQPQAIIDWSSFNIGAGASVYFNQQGNTSWAALNRIWSLNPSLIFGTLKADGKIYLINQNGILFGPGSQINVNALVASALNIKNSDFIKGSLNFYVETGTETTDKNSYDSKGNLIYYDVDLSGNPYSYSGITYTANAAVSNIGTINAATGGSVFLIGPTVENYGIINAPIGQIGLAAGTLMELDIPTVSLGGTSTATQRTALIVDIEGGFGNADKRRRRTIDRGYGFGWYVRRRGKSAWDYPLGDGCQSARPDRAYCPKFDHHRQQQHNRISHFDFVCYLRSIPLVVFRRRDKYAR